MSAQSPSTSSPPNLPPPASFFETKSIRDELLSASRALAELRGAVRGIPNEGILLNTLGLQEAKASSHVENIITTWDDLFQVNLFSDRRQSPEAKEVERYNLALWHGYEHMRKMDKRISNGNLIEMFQCLMKRVGEGFRSRSVSLRKEQTGEDVFVPPQNSDEIIRLMTALEKFINLDEECELDPLIKMALIHHQFESIHPFSDGNGRIGRILNILYLVHSNLLDIPILYLSRYITRTKSDYYRLLDSVRRNKYRDPKAWEDWVLYLLKGVSRISVSTLKLVNEIQKELRFMENEISKQMKRPTAKLLAETLFLHPCAGIADVAQAMDVTRQTAVTRLNRLVAENLLTRIRVGLKSVYFNPRLCNLLMNVDREP